MAFPTKIPLFRRFVLQNFPFIEQDFDALTDYQLICKVVEYLNKVIEVTNETTGQVELLTTAFTQLKDYVDTYFDNLDVQEEINNKLDAMVEDGTLQEIIASYIQSNVAWAFDTVADMKASTNLINGSYAQTFGYHTLNDGGGAFYSIHTKGVSETADEMYKIAIGDSLIAELIIGSELHSKQLGLKGDGETDETTALNAFLDTPSYYKKVLDKGVYVCSDIVYISGLWRQETGNNGVKSIIFNDASLHYTGSINGPIAVLYNLFMSNVEGLAITRNSNRGYVEIVGCWHLTCKDWDIYELNITNANTNVATKSPSTRNNEYISFEHVYVKGTLTIPTTAGQFTNCINFYNSLIGATAVDYCVKISGANSHQQINFLFTDLSYAQQAIFNIEDAQTGHGNITCYGCYFDSAVAIFKDENKNGIVFNNLYSIAVANSNNEIANIKFTDFVNSTNVITYGNRGSNYAGGDVNYAINGDLSSTTESGYQTKFYSASNSSWTKSYETSLLNKNGRCRRMTWIGTGTTGSFVFDTAQNSIPRADKYIAFIRMKIVSGTCDTIQLATSSKYCNYSFAQTGHNEVVLTNTKDLSYNEGETSTTTVKFTNIDTSDEDFVVEIYEVGVVEGTVAKFGLPIASTAVLS